MQVCPNCGEENPDKFRLCGYCGTPLVPLLPAQEVRKTVTIVFSDLKGSTAMGEKLDSEAVREVMTRYFDEMREALEHHGGTIEKYIGDAIMAVFGLPRLHEDDALRAVRAASEMRERLAALNRELDQRWGVTIGNRTGVHTGEVVAGDPSMGQRLVTGDTVNTAARLEQAAPTNEVLLGESTYRLVRHAIEAEPVEPLELKGKADRVSAYRLVSVRMAETIQRQHHNPLVGRVAELDALLSEVEASERDRRCRLATISAQAGVGKSRLIEEFGRRADARIRLIRGRCLPYGRGITFWPLVEVVRTAAGILDHDTTEHARAKLNSLAGAAAEDIAERVASAVGLHDAEFPLEELFWGTRKLFELMADGHTLVVVFEDVHWAEPALLDMIEYIAATSTDAPMLLLCVARPDFLDRHPAWADRSGLLIELKPLSDSESAEVIEHLLGDASLSPDMRSRIIGAAEGNPLFVEQLLSMLIDDGALTRDEHGRWLAAHDLSKIAIPGSIQALLAARLDLLSPSERAVIEPASVIGVRFDRPPLQELVPDAARDELRENLASMTEKQLVQDAHPDSDHRFQHILVRDAAYQGILKRTRAGMHERFADWSERINRDRDRETEFEEILAYHLEQAHAYLSELGPLDDHGIELGRRAGAYLASAGRRAFARGDMGAAANLLLRGTAVLPGDDPARLRLLPDLGEALMETGEFASAAAVLDEAIEQATSKHDERLRADALLIRLLASHHVATDLTSWSADVERVTGEVIPSLSALDAHAELAKAWRMVAWTHAPFYRWRAATDAQKKALDHARRAGDRRLEARMSSAYAQSLCLGPTPVPVAIAQCEEMLERNLGHKQSEALILTALGLLAALTGEFERGRGLCGQARLMLEDIGASVLTATTSLYLARVELLAAAPQAAEAILSGERVRLEKIGEVFVRASITALLAQALAAQNRLEEADRVAREAEELAQPGDVEVESLCGSVRAQVLARQGDLRGAIETARRICQLVPGEEAPLVRTDAEVGLAELLIELGDRAGARDALEHARELACLKQIHVPGVQIEALLDGLGHETTQPIGLDHSSQRQPQ